MIATLKYGVSIAAVALGAFLGWRAATTNGADFLGLSSSGCGCAGWVLGAGLLLLLLAMGMLEGLMVAALALEKSPEAAPAAAAAAGGLPLLGGLAADGETMRRFLLGRQALVLCSDFAIQRVVGLAACLVVVVFAQALPQLVASRHPRAWAQLPGAYAAFRVALAVEASGLTHFGWLVAHGLLQAGEAAGVLVDEPFSVGRDLAGVGVRGESAYSSIAAAPS